MNRKGILLAGGSGTRLHPLTRVVSKHLLPIYDKPMVFYPLSTLMLAGMREILIITTPQDQPLFAQLLGDGSRWGIEITYAAQARPEGIAQALLIAEDFLDGSSCCLILGDNIFYGHGLDELLRRAGDQRSGATVFAYWVRNPGRYGVVEFDDSGRPVSIEEKPPTPRSNYVVTGLYFFDGAASEVAATLQPSKRGELEITDVNRDYLDRQQLRVETLGRGFAWLDTGTPESLIQAANFVQTVELRQGLKVACPEEIALRMGTIEAGQLWRLVRDQEGSSYGAYLAMVLENHERGRGPRG